MDLRGSLSTLRRSWWVPVLGLLVGAAGGLGLTVVQTPQYESTVELFVSTTDTATSSDALTGSEFSQQRVTSYARIVSGDQLADRVIERLGLDLSSDQLSEEISATVIPETALLDVTVTDTSAERAQAIAAAIGQELPALVGQLESPSGATSPISISVIDSPRTASSATSPRPADNLAVGGVLGLLLGSALVLVRARLDRSVRDTETLVAATGAPVIGMIVQDAALTGSTKNHPVRAHEDYRRLRTNLQFLRVDDPPQVIMMTSALAGEGKTTTLVNLARALASAGRRTVVVDADLRRPRVSRLLGAVEGAGLTNVLAGRASLEDVVQHLDAEGLDVLASGPTPPNPDELLASDQMAAALHKLREQYDVVLVDSAPVLPVADSMGLSVLVDGIVLAVRYGSTESTQLSTAVADLHGVGATILGSVLTMVSGTSPLAAASGYGYGYAADPGRAVMEQPLHAAEDPSGDPVAPAPVVPPAPPAAPGRPGTATGSVGWPTAQDAAPPAPTSRPARPPIRIAGVSRRER